MVEIPLSLYAHFPWCVRKCPYCDFNSHALRGEIPEDAYIDALLRDLDFELRDGEPRSLRSIFLGGGTPSLFSDAAIARFLDEAARRLPFAPDIEITLEANPGTADESHFRGYRRAGVNRLSIGVQSLDAGKLKALGRIHDAGEAVRAYRMARDAGFENINLDLMFALPEQSPEQAREDLANLIDLQPEHVSYYHLTLEPNTEFAARPPKLPDEEAAWSMHEQGQSLLGDAGFAQYEVSAYAKPDRRSRHNLNYWQYGDYLGVGAGAHGKQTRGGAIVRRARQKHPKTYLESAGTTAAIQEDKVIPAEELPFEFAMNALRLNDGFALADFERRTGLLASALDRPIAAAKSKGLLEARNGRILPTQLGRAHLNAVLRLFLP
ncbi:MAG TPA: radical SAM family heme chaperone HemW [Nevskiaceae bacterium]|nr:radical SAM family heme chaperone HemW [Nevskiaceae bacterium]